MLFAIFEILDLIASYRIKKLRRFLLYVWVPVIIISVIGSGIIDPDYYEQDCETDWLIWYFYDTCASEEMNIFDNLLRVIFVVIAVILIRKWSIEWNENISLSGVGDKSFQE